jgi:hypothetical protein
MCEHPVKDTTGRIEGYSYEAFKDDLSARPIRLLRLFPAASFDEKIKCELFNTTLDAKNRVGFEALSYTWGDPKITSPITLHGKTHHITKNLEVALRHLRYPERERTLWVDALCINQSNTSEKNLQVQQMKDVYGGGAQRVVVWLGQIPNARRAMDFCARMSMCLIKVCEWTTKRKRMNTERTKDGVVYSWENKEYKAAMDAAKCLWEHIKELGQDCVGYFREQTQHYTMEIAAAQALQDHYREQKGAEWAANNCSEQMRKCELACDAVKVLLERMQGYKDAQVIEEIAWNQVLEQHDAQHAAGVLWDWIKEQKDKQETGVYIKELGLEHKDERKACQELFLDPPWWTRMWILQEVIHSAEVIVWFENGYSVSFEELCDAYSHYKTWTFNLEGPRGIAAFSARDHVKDPPLFSPGASIQQHFNIWFANSGSVSDIRSGVKDLRSAAKGLPTPTNIQYPPKLAGLVMGYRNQQATDPRDMFFALKGMAASGSSGTEVGINYGISVRKLYTQIACSFLKKVLTILLWIESPERPVQLHGAGLPSWVPDYQTKQITFPRIQAGFQYHFCADKDFPPVAQEPRLRQATDDETLLLRGIYIAVVTGIHDARITDVDSFAGKDGVRLITYDLRPESRYKETKSFPQPSWDQPDLVRCTSWGPCHAEIGDFIIVVAGLKMPIVVRPTGHGKYLFVGGCWLIDSEIKIQLFFQMEHWNDESGFSSIMFGSACKGLPENYVAEEFCIC